VGATTVVRYALSLRQWATHTNYKSSQILANLELGGESRCSSVQWRRSMRIDRCSSVQISCSLLHVLRRCPAQSKRYDWTYWTELISSVQLLCVDRSLRVELQQSATIDSMWRLSHNISQQQTIRYNVWNSWNSCVAGIVHQRATPLSRIQFSYVARCEEGFWSQIEIMINCINGPPLYSEVHT